MLDFFGYEEWGARVLDSIEKLMVEGKTLTCDLGGTAKTSEVGDAVIKILESIGR
jgi:tartrate dehydrogenase/decarboxylase/D-malate dehydrogenase